MINKIYGIYTGIEYIKELKETTYDHISKSRILYGVDVFENGKLFSLIIPGRFSDNVEIDIGQPVIIDLKNNQFEMVEINNLSFEGLNEVFITYHAELEEQAKLTRELSDMGNVTNSKEKILYYNSKRYFQMKKRINQIKKIFLNPAFKEISNILLKEKIK